MKKYFFVYLTALLLFCGNLFAESITPQEARNYLGKTVTVSGRVIEYRTLHREAFLDMGARHPHESFTVYCAPETKISRTTLARYEGKRISVTGKMEIFGNRPEIILTSLDQISTQ